MDTDTQLSTIFTPADLAGAVNAIRQKARELEDLAQMLEGRDVAYRGYLRNRPPDCPRLSLTEFWRVSRELEGLYETQEEYLEIRPFVPWCDTPYAREISWLEEMLGI